jgi:hypothetical protein
MKKLFGIALLALPFFAVSAQAQFGPHKLQIEGSWSFTFRNNAWPQTGPWYLYWPLEAHFVAPAPTGYPYWPGPQVLPKMSIGGPAVPPPPVYAPPPAAVVPAPVPAAPPAAAGPALQPTSYYPTPYTRQAPGAYPIIYTGQAPSYWYDR